ncbi:hypothetical protein [Vibrio parahaemolyticus]|uniref:hypothetical protein n=1 Tax=Vibrio parahaemolyticus TaxID=670 RepID=UPI0015DF3546|nr:hypothetical protein [Vibrio parahaemolyticus]MCR9857261.1 hypothetical protein [Vibrio parahaemolyticus]
MKLFHNHDFKYTTTIPKLNTQLRQCHSKLPLFNRVLPTLDTPRTTHRSLIAHKRCF